MSRVIFEPIELFLITSTIGLGVESDPVRYIQSYFDKDGTLVLEIDAYTKTVIYKGTEYAEAQP